MKVDLVRTHNCDGATIGRLMNGVCQTIAQKIQVVEREHTVVPPNRWSFRPTRCDFSKPLTD